jgi:hypothetical protein
MRRLAALTAALLAGTSPVLAADFTVSPPVTDTTGKTLTGTETGIVESGATLETSGTAIGWQGPSPAPGAGATISATSDTFRINSDVVNSTVTINNSGRIVSTGDGQAWSSISFSARSSRATRSRTSSVTATTSSIASTMRRTPISRAGTTSSPAAAS